MLTVENNTQSTEMKLTYVYMLYTVFLHPVTNEVVDTCIAYRNSRRKDGLPRNEAVRRIRQSYSEPVYQRDTT